MAAWPTLKSLRQAGLKLTVDNRPVKLTKKLETALKKAVDYVLFIGAEDLQQQSFNLKHLSSQTENRLNLKQIIIELTAKESKGLLK